MIIGHGDIASVIPDRPDRLFFASGVSDSGETRETEYQREIDLLRKQDRQAHLVYFSSLCVFYSQSRYARHKRQMEFIVQDEFKACCIVRIGNILWGANPNTLINFLRARHAAGLPLEIRDEWRYLVSREEFIHWLALIPPWKAELNIPGERLKVADIVRRYVGPRWPRTLVSAEWLADAEPGADIVRQEMAAQLQGTFG